MKPYNWPRIAGVCVVGFLVGVLVLFAVAAATKSFHRYQARADAENQVKVTAIQIRNQEQRVLIAKQQAQIRKQEAIGIRAAQDEIAKTLTPLYVAHEMTEAMEKIATSGTNNTVIYVPTDPKSGLPIVPTSNTAGK